MLELDERALADAALRQAQDILQRHPELRAKLYEELAKLYPNDPRCEEWKKIAE